MHRYKKSLGLDGERVDISLFGALESPFSQPTDLGPQNLCLAPSAVLRDLAGFGIEQRDLIAQRRDLSNRARKEKSQAAQLLLQIRTDPVGVIRGDLGIPSPEDFGVVAPVDHGRNRLPA